MKICQKCGKENPEVLSSCKYCDTKFANMPKVEERYGADYVQPKTRHWFVTLWLILVICMNLYNVYINAITMQMLEPNLEHLSWVFALQALLHLELACAAVMIFIWKKIGFKMFAGTAILVVILGLLYGEGDIFSPILGLAVIYGLLQIKKDGVSCWEQLK